MPKDFEKKVRKRGGAVKWRNVKKGSTTLKCAVTKKAGPRGGRTVCYKKGKK